MLDAYIIDRIRRERQQRERDGAFVPLHVPVPRPEEREPAEDRREEEGDRGSVVIDFHV